MPTRKYSHREAKLPSHKAASIATAALLFLWVGANLLAHPIATFAGKVGLNLAFFLGLDVIPD